MSLNSSSSYGMSAINCTTYPPLQANPDISGIGLLTSFIATAYLTLICCISKAVLDQEKFKNNRRCKRWSSALEDLIVSLSDQQLVTGISTIIGGLSQLEWGLPVYHFQEVGYLAWFSTMTHVLTLTLMRDSVQSSRPLKFLRIGLMGVLVVMLVCVMAPIGYLESTAIGNNVPFDFPAWCLYHPSLSWGGEGQENDPYGSGGFGNGTKRYNIPYVAFTLAIILYGYASRVLLLFPHMVSGTIFRIPLDQPWTSIESNLEKMRNISTTHHSRFIRKTAWLGHRTLYYIFLFMAISKHLYGSKTWELTWLTLALFWGTVRLFMARYYSAPSLILQESVWGFGQVVALGLLLLPFINFLEGYFRFEEKFISTQHISNTATFTSPLHHNESSKFATKQWFRYLLILWYLMSLGLGAITVAIFPIFLINDGKILVNSNIYIFYMELVAAHIAILWIFILFVTSEWRFLSNKVVLVVLTGFWISVFVGFYIYLLLFDLGSFVQLT